MAIGIALAEAVFQPLDLVLEIGLDQFVPGIALIALRVFFGGQPSSVLAAPGHRLDCVSQVIRVSAAASFGIDSGGQ